MLARIELFSETLDMSTEIVVIGPQKLSSGAPLKVCYLLHGLTGSADNWLQYTALPLWAREGRTLFVLPNAARSWYTDAALGLRYFSYVALELPAYCQKLFNISGEREDTAIMGNSMGGYGALKCALTYPERYGQCCAFSPAALYWQEYLALPNCEGLENEFAGIFGPGMRIPDSEKVPLLARAAARAGTAPQVRVYCGKDDFLVDMNRRFRDEMASLPLQFEYREFDGAHDWAFWNKAMQMALQDTGC